MAGNDQDNLAEIILQFQVDNKSKNDSEKSFKSITSLISDLAIIGKVAGDALGKIWGEVTKTIDIGVRSFKDSMSAMVRGFDATEFNKIAEALDNIGAGRDAAPKLISSFDKYVRGFQDPAMQGDKIKQLYESLGKEGGVDTGLLDMLTTALKNGDSMDALKLMAEAINEAGESGSDLAEMLDLSALANIENAEQFKDFIAILNSSSSVYERNTEKLDTLNDANASITTSFEKLRTLLAEDLSEGVDIAALAIRKLVEDFTAFNSWYQGSMFGKFDSSFREKTKDFISGRMTDPEQMETSSANEKLLYKAMELISSKYSWNQDIFGTKTQKEYEKLAPLIGMNPNQNFNDVAANVYTAAQTPGNQLPPIELAMNLNINTIGRSEEDIQDELEKVIGNALETNFGGTF